MFGDLLGSRSFDSPERPLAHKQASLPITFSGVRLILASIITPTSYLGSWVLVALVITTRFMVDQCPFLLEALTQINNNTFLFQQHLKVTCDLLPPPTHACLPSFEQLIRQQMVQLQVSISECLHHHTLLSMFSDETFKAPSCSNFIMFWLKGRCLLYSSTSFPSLSIIFPSFLHNTLYTIWTTLSLNYMHPSMCLHISHQPYGCPPFMLCSWQQTH